MSDAKHTIAAELKIMVAAYGIDPETFYPEVEIEFSYSAGSPETGPSYSSGGEPATPDEIEVQSVTVVNAEGLDMPPSWWSEQAQNWLDDKGYDLARDKVRDDFESRAADHADSMRDDR